MIFLRQINWGRVVVGAIVLSAPLAIRNWDNLNPFNVYSKIPRLVDAGSLYTPSRFKSGDFYELNGHVFLVGCFGVNVPIDLGPRSQINEASLPQLPPCQTAQRP